MVGLGLPRMAHELDIRRFFQRAPKSWLQRYFQERSVLDDLDWNQVGVRKVDPLLDAWLALDVTVREQHSEDFRNIQLLATPAGKMAIVDEASEVGDPNAVAEALENLDDLYSCAFWTLLEQPRLWEGAVFFAEADSRPKRYWRKRINLPPLSRPAGKSEADRLGAAVAKVFREKEARGTFCHCHQYRRGGKIYYFLYPQDHLQTPLEYDDKGDALKRPHRFAFDVIIIHDDQERTLSIWHDGSKDRVKDLQVIFAREVLGAEIQRDSDKDDRIYDLNRFMDPDYQIELPEGLPIKSASVRKIRVHVFGPNARTIRIDLSHDCPDHVLHESLESALRDIPRSLVKVTLVGIRAEFEPQRDQKRNCSRTFEIISPNSCSLRTTPNDIVLQRMLTLNGLEPRQEEPSDDN